MTQPVLPQHQRPEGISREILKNKRSADLQRSQTLHSRLKIRTLNRLHLSSCQPDLTATSHTKEDVLDLFFPI